MKDDEWNESYGSGGSVSSIVTGGVRQGRGVGRDLRDTPEEGLSLQEDLTKRAFGSYSHQLTGKMRDPSPGRIRLTTYEHLNLIAAYLNLIASYGGLALIYYGIRVMANGAEIRAADSERKHAEAMAESRRREEEGIRRHEESMASLRELIERTR